MRGSLNCSSAFSYSASFSSPVSSFHPWRVRRPQTSSSVASPVWTFVLRLLMSLVLNVGNAKERRRGRGVGWKETGFVGREGWGRRSEYALWKRVNTVRGVFGGPRCVV